MVVESLGYSEEVTAKLKGMFGEEIKQELKLDKLLQELFWFAERLEELNFDLIEMHPEDDIPRNM